MKKYKNICYIASKKITSSRIIKILESYKIFSAHIQKSLNPDLILALGGDGFMINSIHDFLESQIPIYGINCGNMGFLLNEFDENTFLQKIDDAVPLSLMILDAQITVATGEIFVFNAVNEVYVMRNSYKALGLRVSINDEIKITRFVGDGLIVATPVGSSAYNYSAGGSILPSDSDLLVLTPINPFRPKSFSSIILPDSVSIKLEASEPIERGMNVIVDSKVVENVQKVVVCRDKNKSSTVLFDRERSFAKKMIDEQFLF